MNPGYYVVTRVSTEAPPKVKVLGIFDTERGAQNLVKQDQVSVIERLLDGKVERHCDAQHLREKLTRAKTMDWANAMDLLDNIYESVLTTLDQTNKDAWKIHEKQSIKYHH